MTAPALILGRQEIAEVMTLDDYIAAVEKAFARYAAAKMSVPDVVHIAAPEGAFHVKSAGYKGEPDYVAVKVNGNFPDNQERNGLPTIQGAIVLCDGRNGSLLAVLDSTEVTAMRTAAATAVAAKYLAPSDAKVATIIGCGVQGRVQLRFLLEVLQLETVYAYDSDHERRDHFALDMSRETGLRVLPVDEFSKGTGVSQVIVTCTSSRSAFLRSEHISEGAFIAAVGADNHDKQELDPELIAKSRVVVDVMEQCVQIGELHHALAAGAVERSDVFAELGNIVAGITSYQYSSGDTVVFDSTGSAIQDVAAAGIIYERARAAELGLSVEFS